MKHLIIITLLLCSCTKDWECCTNIQAHDTGSPLLDNNPIKACTDFRGTKQERKAFEEKGTLTEDLGVGYLDQVTTCVKD